MEVEGVKREPSHSLDDAPPTKRFHTGGPGTGGTGLDVREEGNPTNTASVPSSFRSSAIPEPEGPLTLEDIDRFQKEALYRQLNVYKRERDILQSQLDALERKTNEALEAELKAANDRYLSVAKAFERLQSFSLRRCAMDVPKKDPSDPMRTSEQAGAATDNANTSAVSNYNGPKSGSGAGAGESLELLLANSKQEIAGLCGSLEARERQLGELDSTYQATRRELERATTELESMSEDSIRKFDSYIALEKQLSALQSGNKVLEVEVAEAQQQLASIRSEREVFELNIKQKYDAYRADLEAKLEAAENDVARLRSARDDILGELNAKKAGEVEQIRSFAQMKELFESVSALKSAREHTVETAPEMEQDETVEQLKARVQKLSRQNLALAAELPALEQAFMAAQSAAVAKISEQAAIEAKVNAIASSKARADEKYFSAMRARDAVAAELATTKKVLAKTAAQVSVLTASEEKLTATCQKLRSQAAEADLKVSAAQRSTATAERLRATAETHLEAKRKQTAALQASIASKDEQLSAFQLNLRNKDAELEKLKKQLEVQRATTGKGTPQAVQEQLDALRSIALCSLCTKSWKDTAIKLCGHVFCHDCAQARLDARMRKCPLCNMQFGQNDLLSVHL